MRAKTLFPALVAGCLWIPSPARAVTAGDVVDKMDPHQRNAFISGAVDMASQLYWRAGNTEKGNCAIKWYFETDGSVGEVMGLLENYKDKEAVSLIEVLISRHCGK